MPEGLAEHASTFAPFTLAHGVTVLVITLAITALCILGLKRPASQRHICIALGVFGLLWALVNITYFCRPSAFNWGTSLPLQICDLAGFIAPIAILTQLRIFRTLLYFFAFALSTQAFMTPIVRFGPDHFEFWVFWVSHTIIVGYAIFDVLVLGYRPSLRDLLMTMALGLLYIAAMLATNHLLRAHWANYGFVGNVNLKAPTLLDKLGTWPLRVVWIVLIANAVFVMVWAVWPISRLIFKHRTVSPEQPS